MSRARAALQALKIRHPEEAALSDRHDNVLQWVLSKWADQQRRTELPVSGSSMWPVLRSGERIVVRHGGRPPVVGEIVVFLQQERTLAHRVIRRRGSAAEFQVRAKGDFTLVADPGWLGPDRIVGVVESVVRGGHARRRFGLRGFPA
ncbi:MAG TPA: S24/S26 family peptidase, partial [Candidatus Polarisedimenticolia bacterium]|nr:S24/S26 family peptidase [Candidatus Polarisedimenticolia bacterium]